jgi:hypothetical protein
MDCLRIGQYRKTVELVVACAHLVRALSASKVTRRIFFWRACQVVVFRTVWILFTSIVLAPLVGGKKKFLDMASVSSAGRIIRAKVYLGMN